MQYLSRQHDCPVGSAQVIYEKKWRHCRPQCAANASRNGIFPSGRRGARHITVSQPPTKRLPIGQSISAKGMSDGKKKGAGAGNAQGVKASKAPKLIDTLNKICTLAKDLKEDTQGVQEFSQILEDRDRLDAEIKEKKAKLRELRGEMDEKISKLTSENEKLKTDKKVLWNEFRSQNQGLESQLGSLRDIEVKLEEAEIKLQSLSDQAWQAEQERKHNRAELTKTSAKLKKLETFAQDCRGLQEYLGTQQCRSQSQVWRDTGVSPSGLVRGDN